MEPLRHLLAVLDPSPQQAGERYERIRARLVFLFRARGCAAPEDLADETIDRVARRLEGGEKIAAADVTGYFVGVANLVALEAQRKQLRVVPLEEDWPAPPPAEPAEEDEVTAARRRRCLRGCLAKLRPPQRDLLLRYLRGDGPVRAALAAELKIELNALRIRAHRARVEVEDCVRSCLAGAP